MGEAESEWELRRISQVPAAPAGTCPHCKRVLDDSECGFEVQGGQVVGVFCRTFKVALLVDVPLSSRSPVKARALQAQAQAHKERMKREGRWEGS